MFLMPALNFFFFIQDLYSDLRDGSKPTNQNSLSYNTHRNVEHCLPNIPGKHGKYSFFPYIKSIFQFTNFEKSLNNIKFNFVKDKYGY